MIEYKQCTHEEAMNLSKETFMARCKAWMNEFNDGQLMKVDNPLKCPVNIWVKHNHAHCGKDLVANTTYCEICGEACCPECHNHDVMQISRVTGYMGDVAGWNAGKKQEFKDRMRHNELETN